MTLQTHSRIHRPRGLCIKKGDKKMRMFNVYEKKSGLFVGTITIATTEIRRYEKDFILV